MAHCTHRSALAALALVCLALFGAAAPPAWADGDPASDVLATQSLFLAQDAGAPAAQQAELAGLLQEAQRAGFPIRVAVIASPADLGSVTALWRRPQGYARFLGQELTQVYAGRLLVVMPSGLGLYGFPDAGRARAAVAGSPSGRAGLVGVAVYAVQRLAGAAGHRLAPPVGSSPAGTGGSSHAGAWAAFAVGLLAMLAAWIASFRARRPRLRFRRSQTPQPAARED